MWLLLHAPPETHENPGEDARMSAARSASSQTAASGCHFPPRGPRSQRDVGCHMGSEHMQGEPGASIWSHGARAGHAARAAPRHCAGLQSTWAPASPQGPQCQGVGGGHGAPARRAPSIGVGTEPQQHRPQGTQFIVIWKNRTSRCPYTSCWRPTRFLKRADQGRESNAHPVSSRRHSSGSQGCWLGLVLSSGMV